MNRRQRALAFLAAVGVLRLELAAERLPVRVLTTAEGLPRDQLTCVRPDARGFVWFCTAEGLVRFDGHVAVTFGKAEGLNPPGVRSFLITRTGRYWVGADAKLFEFTPSARDGAGRFHVVARDDGQSTGGVNALSESRDGSVWVGTGRGLLHLTFGHEGPRLSEVEIGLPRKVDNDWIVRAVLEDERGMLWVGAGSGLYARRPDGTVTRLTMKDGLPNDEVRAIALDGARRLWVGTRECLCLIDRAAMERHDPSQVRRIYTTRKGLPANDVRAIYPQDDTLWVGTLGGVIEMSPTSNGDLKAGRALTGFFAWGIAGDSRGNIWVATEAGARRLTPHGFVTYSTEDGLTSNRVASLFENQAGDLCATTMQDVLGLSCFDGRRFNPIVLRRPASVRHLGFVARSQLTLQDRQGRWWISSGEGLLALPSGPAALLASTRPIAVYDTRSGLRSNKITRLFEDSRGGIWIATFAEEANGLARLDPTTGNLHVFGATDGVSDNLPIVHAFAEDRAGNVWVGLEVGQLIRHRAGRFEAIDLHPEQPPAAPRPTYDHLRSLLVDRDGRLWIASTIYGLGRVEQPDADSPKVKWYGRSQGLSSDTAWILVQGPSTDIFVGTGRGIDRFNPATERFVQYSAEDGVPRGEILAALRDRTGHLWFATTDGVARFAVAAEPPSPPPLTMVTAVRVAGVPVPVAADGTAHVDAISVQPGDRRVEIDFVSPGARAADGLRYQHQLEGVDRMWTTTDARTVALAGAAPGRYRFLVRAVLANGVIGDTASVELTVLAPLWRRWWFVALAAAALATAGFAVHRARVRHLVEVATIRARIAADLHDGVGANLSRIAILSDVVRQQAAVALPQALPALASIGDNARELIDDMSDAVWSIDPRLDNLQEVVVRARAMASDLFDGRRITWWLHAPENAAQIEMAAEQRRHLYLILKESLTNVVRHANASTVVVRLTAPNGRVCLDIEDDGVGLAGNRSPRSPSHGHGLENIRARAAALGGTVTIAPGPGGGGTRIVVDAPLRPPA